MEHVYWNSRPSYYYKQPGYYPVTEPEPEQKLVKRQKTNIINNSDNGCVQKLEKIGIFGNVSEDVCFGTFSNENAVKSEQPVIRFKYIYLNNNAGKGIETKKHKCEGKWTYPLKYAKAEKN